MVRQDRFGNGSELLDQYIRQLGQHVVEVAYELSVDALEMLSWLDGESRPTSAMRLTMQYWSGGAVPAASWGAVRPSVPPDLLPRRLLPPPTRAHCLNGPRPCPHLACKYHLWTDTRVSAELPLQSCALDIADEGGHTLDEIAVIMGCTRERIRQVEVMAIAKIRRREKLLEQLM